MVQASARCHNNTNMPHNILPCSDACCSDYPSLIGSSKFLVRCPEVTDVRAEMKLDCEIENAHCMLLIACIRSLPLEAATPVSTRLDFTFGLQVQLFQPEVVQL